MRIAVTGGTGKAGRWVVKDLREHGHEVRNIDARHDGADHGQTWLADLADYGQAVEAPHLVVLQHGPILQEGLQEIDGFGAPEYFAVHYEARDAEYSMLRRFIGVVSKLVFQYWMSKALRVDGKLPAQRGEAPGIVGMLAAHPYRKKSAFDGLGPAVAG